MEVRLSRDVNVNGIFVWGLVETGTPGTIISNDDVVNRLGIYLVPVKQSGTPTKVFLILDGRGRDVGPNGSYLKKGTLIGTLIPEAESSNDEQVAVERKPARRTKSEGSS